MIAQQRKNTFQRPFSDAIVLTLNKEMPVLTKYWPEHTDRPNETSDNQPVIYPLKGTTITLEKRSKNGFSDVMELTLGRNIPTGQQTTYCFVNVSSFLQ